MQPFCPDCLPRDIDVEHALSSDRFGRYLTWAEDNRHRAIELYCRNVAVSEAFYTPLHFLEVALRNRFDSVISQEHGPEWFHNKRFTRAVPQAEKVAQALTSLKQERKEPTPGRIVAALPFGFWTAFTNTTYEEEWRRLFFRVGRKGNRNLARKDLAKPLSRFRKLRNRIAHHEPILAWRLTYHHDLILDVTQMLSPPAAHLARRLSRVTELGDIPCFAETAAD